MKVGTAVLDAHREAMAALEAEMLRETATTPKELIHAQGTLRLHHYLPQTADVFRVPLLIVMSIVSKPYIFDLTPGQSFVEHLVRAGFDVYLIDWGTPRSEHREMKVDDYVAELIPECIAQVQAHSGQRELTLIGYCLGGIFTALHAAMNPRGPVKNLLFIATPVNAEGMELQRKLLTQGLDPDLIVDTLGNIPPAMVEAAFQLMRPLQKAAGQATLLNNAADPAFVKAHLRIVRWGADALPLPGETFRQLAHDFVHDNKICKGEFEVRGRKANLRDITVPVLHVVAEHDHVVPSAASGDLVRLVGSRDKEEVTIKGGHVSLVAGAGAVTRTWPRLVNWLAPRSL
ncbi:alpha/beta fold hydrolase [Piscinibacter sp. XHJ-5]|uniref:alpha/beta fold hydrolase n=1 Tax=Piscinibacter sp. XHJ-5 TaxID=3037797 RepID=UPI002452AC64|nr:alpha/beta fold hydrolase [Piscinibacter sp. XHJ-5]